MCTTCWALCQGYSCEQDRRGPALALSGAHHLLEEASRITMWHLHAEWPLSSGILTGSEGGWEQGKLFGISGLR